MVCVWVINTGAANAVSVWLVCGGFVDANLGCAFDSLTQTAVCAKSCCVAVDGDDGVDHADWGFLAHGALGRQLQIAGFAEFVLCVVALHFVGLYGGGSGDENLLSPSLGLAVDKKWLIVFIWNYVGVGVHLIALLNSSITLFFSSMEKSDGFNQRN